jgi:hypothetical protein
MAHYNYVFDGIHPRRVVNILGYILPNTRQTSQLGVLVVYVVDFDGIAPYDNTGHEPFVGPAITRLV